jgi:hypothetical protein
MPEFAFAECPLIKNTRSVAPATSKHQVRSLVKTDVPMFNSIAQGAGVA